jgi:two-component system, NtrC family, sensor histidine kinase PilS
MLLQQPENAQIKQWQLLTIYNSYRIICILFFFCIYMFSAPAFNSRDFFYLTILFIYFVLALFSFYFCKKHLLGFDKQVFIYGALDIICITMLIDFIGGMQSGFGILLNVTVAALSILVPGKLAIFFAAIASSMLLGISFIKHIYGETLNFSSFYSSGIQGASIFATALTALYLAYRVRISEKIAYRRGNELASMQRINEFIVERLHSGVIYVDLKRHIHLINSAAKNFFNLKANNLMEDLAQVSVLLDEKCQQFLDNIQYNHQPVQAIIKKPYLRVHFLSAAVDNQTAVLIFLDDMASIAQQAQQLKLASLGRLSASIAHELRNPLGAISHAVQLLGEANCLSTEDLRLKELINNNCNRMNGVIKNILQLSRREQSHPQVIDFRAFIIHFKRDFCIYNQCSITLNLPEDEDVYFVFDKSQLEQLLVILCSNSMQHGRDEQGNVFIIITVIQNYPYTEIFVSNTGPGIPEELQHDIFEPFFSTVRTGFGMGLFIAKDLCEINLARLSVLPSKKGSCFEITINQTSEISL